MGKKVLACFGENLGGQEAFQAFAERLDRQGFEVHLFDRVIDMGLKPHSVLNIMEHVWKERLDDNEYYFLTDIKDYFKLVYRTFHQTFTGFIFWSGWDNVYDVDLEDIYANLLGSDIYPEERLYKRIYINDLAADFDSEFLNSQKVDMSEFPANWEAAPQPEQQVVYRFAGQCYLIEPSTGKTVYVDLDSEKVADEIKYADIIMPCEVDKDSVEQTESMLELIARDYESCLRRQDTMHKVFSLLRSNILAGSRVEQKYYCSLLEVMGEGYGIYAEIAALSLLLQIYRESRFYKKILSICLAGKHLTVQNKYFVLSQCKHIELFDRIVNARELLKTETLLFQEIAGDVKMMLEKEFNPIQAEDVDKDAIVVMTSQLLSYAQLQTRYAMELASGLAKRCGKKVWLINTCETLTQNGRIPFFDISASNILGEYSNSNVIEFEGTRIPFYQMITPMPDYGGIAGILEFLQEIKPALLINIGEISVTAQVCAAQIPCIFMPPTTVRYLPAVGQTLVVDRKLPEEIAAFYSESGIRVITLSGTLDAENLQKEGFLEAVLAKYYSDESKL